jgi:uncharacterized protein YbaR (Trm112 family)
LVTKLTSGPTPQMHTIINLSFDAARDQLAPIHMGTDATRAQGLSQFQLFGFDFLVDAQYKVWLLEINGVLHLANFIYIHAYFYTRYGSLKSTEVLHLEIFCCPICQGLSLNLPSRPTLARSTGSAAVLRGKRRGESERMETVAGREEVQRKGVWQGRSLDCRKRMSQRGQRASLSRDRFGLSRFSDFTVARECRCV